MLFLVPGHRGDILELLVQNLAVILLAQKPVQVEERLAPPVGSRENFRGEVREVRIQRPDLRRLFQPCFQAFEISLCGRVARLGEVQVAGGLRRPDEGEGSGHVEIRGEVAELPRTRFRLVEIPCLHGGAKAAGRLGEGQHPALLLPLQDADRRQVLTQRVRLRELPGGGGELVLFKQEAVGLHALFHVPDHLVGEIVEGGDRGRQARALAEEILGGAVQFQ